MKRALKWLALLAAVLVLAAAVGRAMVARKAEAPRVAAETPALELASSDLVLLRQRELLRAIEVTGTLKAVDSAVVKAKVAAELTELTVREGDRVAAGQVLGRLDATEFALKLRQAEQQSASAQAQLDIAERALENNRALVDQGFISKNALDTSVSNAAAARAALQAARAAADLARKSQSDTVLKAPIAGLVSQRLVQPGERVPIDAKLIEIVDLSRLEIEAALTPQDVAALSIGAPAQLQVDGLAAPVSAKVARINPAAQAGTRAVMVYLAVDARPGLRQGLFARGRIEVERRRALALPSAALHIEQARPYVLAVVDGKVVQRDVTLGLRGATAVDGQGEGELTEITAGLAAGTPVLRGSVGGVREGTPVRVTTLAAGGASEAAAAPPPPAAGH